MERLVIARRDPIAGRPDIAVMNQQMFRSEMPISDKRHQKIARPPLLLVFLMH